MTLGRENTIGQRHSPFNTLTMPRRILFLTLRTFSLMGGIEKVCRVFTRAIYDLGEAGQCTPAIYSIYDKDIDRDSRYINKDSFRAFNGNKGWFVISSVRKGVKSDVVVLSHINLLFVALLIKRFSPSTRIILFAHGIEVWRPLSKWKSNLLQSTCETWAVSQYTATQLMVLHNVPAGRIHIINNCLDPFMEIPNTFHKPQDLLAKYNLKADQPILFTLTRLSSSELYKGYDQVMLVLKSLTKSYPGMKYLLAGKADKKEAARIQAIIQEHQLESNILMLGFLPEEELIEHFQLADVFVMPSKKEGFGLVFIEATACGCSVIAGNQDGSTDALLNGELGTLVDAESEAELLEAIVSNLKTSKNITNARLLQQMCLSRFGYQSYLEKIKLRIQDDSIAC